MPSHSRITSVEKAVVFIGRLRPCPVLGPQHDSQRGGRGDIERRTSCSQEIDWLIPQLLLP
jgi:hypothetical protein